MFVFSIIYNKFVTLCHLRFKINDFIVIIIKVNVTSVKYNICVTQLLNITCLLIQLNHSKKEIKNNIRKYFIKSDRIYKIKILHIQFRKIYVKIYSIGYTLRRER